MDMNIERLVEKYERDVKRILKASRIYPDMVTQFSIYFVTFKALKMFEGLGVDVELRLPAGANVAMVYSLTFFVVSQMLLILHLLFVYMLRTCIGFLIKLP